MTKGPGRSATKSPLRAVYRAWLHRKLQWPTARQRDAVRFAQPCQRAFGDLERRLQYHQATRALGNLPPAVYAKTSAPGMQRDGTLRYINGSAPRPVAAPPSQQGSNETRALPIGG
jgi:hypothetical protein